MTRRSPRTAGAILALLLALALAALAGGERAGLAAPRATTSPRRATPPAAPTRASSAPAAVATSESGEAWARAAVFELTSGRPDRAASLAARAIGTGAIGVVPLAAVRYVSAEALVQAGDPDGARAARDALRAGDPGSPWARAAADLSTLEGGSPAADAAFDAAAAATRGPLGLVAAVACGERLVKARGAAAAEAWGRPLEPTAAGPFWLLLVAHADLAAGDTTAARAALERAVDRAAAQSDVDLVSEAALRRAALAYQKGDAAGALHWLERVTTDRSRPLACPAAILEGYAHYRLGHAHEAAVAFSNAQACARDRGERGRLLALEARCRAEAGEYRLAAAVAGDGAEDLEAAARGQGVGVSRLTDATDVLNGALALDVDRALCARGFLLAQGASEGWLAASAEGQAFVGFPFRVVREEEGEGARADARAGGAPVTPMGDVESPATRAARVAALGAADQAEGRARLVQAVARDAQALVDSLGRQVLTPAESLAAAGDAGRRAGDVAEQSAKVIEARAKAVAAQARARADFASARARALASPPARREERAEALDRAALEREASLQRAAADTAEARARAQAAWWRGPGRDGLARRALAELARQQGQARELLSRAQAALARAQADPAAAGLATARDAARDQALARAQADTALARAHDAEDGERARAHTAELARRAQVDYEVALFERAAWAAIALDESDSTERDLAGAIGASDQFLARFPQSRFVPAVQFNRADLDVRLAYARAHVTGRPPDFRAAVARYEGLLAVQPPYARRDAVLFNLAALARESNDNATADRRLEELVATAPGSELAAEAHLELGDRALDAEQWAAAETHYAAVAAAGGSLVPMARYKQGFAALKRGDAAAAETAFGALLALPNLPEEIQSDGLAQLAKALKVEGGAPAAERFLAAQGGVPYEHALLVTLAAQQDEDGAFDGAAKTYRLALTHDPKSTDGLALARKSIAAWDARGHDDERQAARLDLGRFLAPTGPGGALGDEARAQGARWMLEGAFLAHDAGRRKKDAAALEAAVAAYRELASLYPRSDSLALAASSEGEALFDLGRYEESAHAHERAAAMASAPPDLKREAEFGAALARERVAAGTRYESAPARDSLERAVTRFEADAPSDPRVPPLWLSLGLGAKDHADPTRARRVFEHVAGRDTSEASRRGQAELGRIALSEDRWEDAEKFYADAANGYLAAGDHAEETRLSDLAASARFKSAEEREAHGDTLGAAATFRAVAERYPNFGHADAALYRAGQAALAGGQPHEADLDFANLRDRFPRSALAGEALLSRGDALLAQRDSLGASQVLAGATLAGGDSAAVQAVEAAARIAHAAGALTDAEALDRRLARESPDPRSRTRALADLALLLYEQGRRAELPAVLAPWRTGRMPAGLAPDPAADVSARFVLGRVLADSCLALPLANPIKPALDRKLAALGPALENLKAAAPGVDSPFWSESGAVAGALLEDLGTRLSALPPPTVMSSADSAGFRAAVAAQAGTFFTRAEDVWIAALEGLKSASPAAALDTLPPPTRPRDGWPGRIWEKLEPRLAAHVPFRLSAADLPPDGAKAAPGDGLVASLEGGAPQDSSALDVGAQEDLRNRMRWISDYVAKGQLDDAASWCDDALKVFPQRAEIWNDEGVVRARRGDWAGAMQAWNEALTRNAKLPSALYNRAVFERFYLLDRPAARRDFERFLATGATFDETLADRMAEERKP